MTEPAGREPPSPRISPILAFVHLSDLHVTDARHPFRATGLGLPWYAVYGNHDALLGGTLAPVGDLGRRATGSEKTVGVDKGLDVLALLVGNETSPSPGDWGLLSGPRRAVTPDDRRRPVDAREWIRAHLGPDADPPGHGFDEEAAASGRTHYGFDAGIVRCLVLDTVNRAGGWQGSIPADELVWLEAELARGHSRHLGRDGTEVRTGHADRLFVLFSHHSLETLVNDFAPDGEIRHLAGKVLALLGRFPNVVCWLNGHTHVNAVTPVRVPGRPGLEPIGRGNRRDRNVLCVLPAPFPLALPGPVAAVGAASDEPGAVASRVAGR